MTDKAEIDHPDGTRLVGFSISLALVVAVTALIIMGTIVYLGVRYRQISVVANDYHYRMAYISGEALSSLAEIERLLFTSLSPETSRIREITTHLEVFERQAEQLLDTEMERGSSEHSHLTLRLDHERKLLRPGPMFAAPEPRVDPESSSTSITALRLTLRQLQRIHQIEHEKLSEDLERLGRNGFIAFFVVVVVTLGTGTMVGCRVLNVIRRTVKRQLEAEQALSEHRDQLEDAVRARTIDLEHANQELESFSYTVSHDLRAPLRSIHGFAHLLKDEHGANLDPEAISHIERISHNALKMGVIIEDLLRLSFIGRKPLQISQLDLSVMARRILKLKQDEDDREVGVEVSATPPATGDSGLMQVALENLLSNSWKYTGRTRNARISFDSLQEDGQTIYRVRDNGAGFDMAYADKLFNPFQRLHNDKEFQGSGIGLATARRIIQRHGGRIWAEAEVDKGATFYFTLKRET